MQEFFMDYGLWLLIALLVIIGIVFLLSGRNRPSEPSIPAESKPVTAPVAAPPLSVPVETIAPEPVMAAPAAVPSPTRMVDVGPPASATAPPWMT